MEGIISNRQYVIAPLNSSKNIFGELSRFGLSKDQIIRVRKLYGDSDLRAKLIETKKLTFPNLPALFLKVKVKELPRKPKKPKQLVIRGLLKRK